MKPYVMAIVTFAVFAGTASAQHGSASLATGNRYLGANGAIFHDGFVLVGDANSCVSSGFCGDVWVSRSFDQSSKPNFGNELDLSAWHSHDFGSWASTAGAAIFFVTPVFDGAPKGDVVQLSAQASFPGAGGVRPFVRIEHYLPMRGVAPRSGTMLLSGATTVVELNKKTSLFVEAKGLYDSGAFGFESGFLARGTASITRTLSQRTSIGYKFVGSTPIWSKQADTRGTYGASSVSIQTKF